MIDINIYESQTCKTVSFGRKGENLARRILFDLSALIAEFGDGDFEWVVRRPHETDVYIALGKEQNGNIAILNLTLTETAISGYGGLELRYYVDDVISKTIVWRTSVAASLGTNEVPEPIEDYIDRMREIANEASESADAAGDSATQAATSAANAANSATVTAGYVANAAASASAAHTSEVNAANSASLANGSATQAAGSASAASDSASAASGSAAAAAQSATQAAGSATQAAQSATAASSSAQDIAASAAQIQTNKDNITELKNDLNVNRTLVGTFVSRNLIHYLRPFHWLDNKQRNTTGAVVDRTGWATSVETIPITPNARYYTNADVFVYYDADGNYVSTQDRASGSNSIKALNNSAIAYAYINWKSIVEADTKYAVKEETGHKATWLIEHAQDYEIAPNENIVDDTDDNLQFRNLPIIQFSESALFSKRLTAMLTGEKIIQDFLRDRYGSMGITDYSNHDGTVIYCNGMLYSIFSSYTGNGDAANNPNCRVVLVGIEESTHNRTVDLIVAKNGDVHGSYAQNGGAGSPNAYLIGTTIHILYTAYINSAYMMMHCTYNIETGELDNYSPVLVDNAILNNAWFNNRYGYAFSAGAYQNSQANSTIATDGNGTYYIGWCFGSGTYGVGVIFETRDFINWTVFYDYSDWTISPIYEMATAYKDGYVYFCIRPDATMTPNRINNSAFGNYSDIAIVGKVAVSNGKLNDSVKVYNCGSRPAFFTVSDEVYLYTNPYDRAHGQIIKINSTILAESEIIAEFIGGYSYPSFFVDGTTIYTLVSDNFMRLSKFTLPNISEATMQNALYTVLTS